MYVASSNIMTYKTFHLFPRLPLEIRLEIWHLILEARIIAVKLTYRNQLADGSFLPDPKKIQSIYSSSSRITSCI